jgi:hypothetical protein
MRLRNICVNTKRVILRKDRDNNTCFRIDYLVRVWKKGGKKIRKFFCLDRERNNTILNSRSYNTFCNLVDVNLDPTEQKFLPVWGGTWSVFSYTNDFKNFVFKLRYNQLPLNNRINSYRNEVNPACTFCMLNKVDPAPRDSLAHCFLHCNTVRQWLSGVQNLTNFKIDFSSTAFQKLYWFGTYDTETLTLPRITVFNLFFDAFKYIVFKYRLRRRIPEVCTIIDELRFFIFWTCKSNKKIKAQFAGVPELARFSPASG